MSGVNPQGVVVHSFKTPSPDELDHDFLWRYACRLPGRGQIGIFNRSHYEEVLVVRVHPDLLERQSLPKTSGGGDIWRRRYREINDWERHLSDNGIRVVKLFLGRRISARLLADAQPHQHRARPVVRDPRGPQVVCADRGHAHRTADVARPWELEPT